MSERPRTLVVIATYNEIENLPRLVDEVLEHAPHVDVLVIDDNSPDGTGKWCDERAAEDSRVRVHHRSGKLGLGTATLTGFRDAIENNYELVLTMDADFSHPPQNIPEILDRIEDPSKPVDVVIGSRYVEGGGVEGWPLHRRLMSRAVNLYARWLLWLTPHDCSGAFRCYRIDTLRKLDFDAIRSRGYSYLEEILWRLKKLGVVFAESPIVFVDRQAGHTKINMREAVVALLMILRLGIFGR